MNPDDAASAYPLIQSARSQVTLESWMAFVQSIHSRPHSPAGIITVENTRGYLQGLFNYTVGESLQHGTSLNIDIFVALDTGDRAVAVTMLIGVMEDLAREYRCRAIHTDLPEPWLHTLAGPSAMISQLRKAGYDAMAVKLCKALPPPCR